MAIASRTPRNKDGLVHTIYQFPEDAPASAPLYCGEHGIPLAASLAALSDRDLRVATTVTHRDEEPGPEPEPEPRSRVFRGPLSVTTDYVEDGVAITVWNPDNVTVDARIVVTTTRISDFMASVVRSGAIAMESATGRIATGYCATCSNLGTVVEPAEEGERQGRTVYCPDCRSRRITGQEAFAIAPNAMGRGRPQ